MDDARAYYNEHDPFAADWLENLIAAGHIAPGIVDRRSIVDVRADDLRGFTQCHFFAGIGGWSYALRLAGWPDDRPVWTGSCPCQPFSAAGKGGGFDDERHLWPYWFGLIRKCRPSVIFGEQVASTLAVGRTAPYMPEMWDREAVAAVLRELQGPSAPLVHRVREGRGAWEKEGRSGEDLCAIQAVEERAPWLCAGERGALPREGQGASLHIGGGGYPEEDRRGHLRDDGNPVRPEPAKGMELPLFGPDRAGGRLHDGERQGGPVRPERDGKHLGTATDRRDCECDCGEAPGEVERLIESLGGTSQSSPQWAWVDAVRSDLDRAGYSFGMVVAPSAGVGAPHIRQRLGFVADANECAGGQGGTLDRGRDSGSDALARTGPSGNVVPSLVADSNGRHASTEGLQRSGEHGLGPQDASVGDSDWPGPTNGFWRNADWLFCRDGKWRPVEPGISPLVDGISGRVELVRTREESGTTVQETHRYSRVGALRGYGNAINPQQFAQFIGSYLDVRG